MISLDAIAVYLPRLTGDAVKVAVLVAISTDDEFATDARAVRRVAKDAGLTAEVVRAVFAELTACGLLVGAGRALRAGPAAGMLAGGAVGERKGRGEGGVREGAGASLAPPDGLQRSVDLSEPEASKEPPELGTDPVSSSDTVLDEPPPWERSAPRVPPLRVLTDRFGELYREANAGAAPTWDGKRMAFMKQLLTSHGLEEVLRRMEIMFKSPPSWPPPPHDMTCFRSHFDRFAKPAGPRGGVADRAVTPADYWKDEP